MQSVTADVIASALEREITAGEIGPGTELIQANLATRFAVSRIPVRDALRLLAATGLVTITPNRGARVIQLTRDEVREVCELRVLLECDCLKRAIPRMTSDHLKRLDHVRQRSDFDAVTDDCARGDWEFHAALYAPAGRRQQVDIIHRLRRTCQMHVATYRHLPSQTPEWLTDHARLVDHCRSGHRKAAAELLKKHIASAGRTLIDAMSE